MQYLLGGSALTVAYICYKYFNKSEDIVQNNPTDLKKLEQTLITFVNENHPTKTLQLYILTDYYDTAGDLDDKIEQNNIKYDIQFCDNDNFDDRYILLGNYTAGQCLALTSHDFINCIRIKNLNDFVLDDEGYSKKQNGSWHTGKN